MDDSKTRLDALVKDLKRLGRIKNVTEMARIVGIDRSAFSDYQNGGRPITRKIAGRIADAYPEVDPEWLVNPLATQPYKQDGKYVAERAEKNVADSVAKFDQNSGNDMLMAALIDDDYRLSLQKYIDRLTKVLEQQQIQIDLLTTIIRQLHD